MELSQNEIKENARLFEKRWGGTKKESANSQSFYNDFFEVFGLRRDSVAKYEVNVKKQNGETGEIDVLWKGVFLAEHKSAGKDLEKAYKQANEYVVGLPKEDKPRYVLVSDFNKFEFYDKELDEHYSFTIDEFHKHIHLFGFITGYQEKVYQDLEVANIKASEMMGRLYDTLKKDGYAEHDLEKFLVRILFCLFADDTGIFNKDIFKKFIIEYTHEEGHDLGAMLLQLFEVLNKPEEARGHISDVFKKFPYINGDLFSEVIGFPSFNKQMRAVLIDCSDFDWSGISPAIFGSLFQSVSDKQRRREKGEHYTSEKNILKTIRPLFLDDLHTEFKEVRNNKKKLEDFHQKLANLKFLDPACGCGNFLVVTYREIRLLELEVIKVLHPNPAQVLDISMLNHLLLVNVDNFYGIELEEFPAKIAEVALWLVDHQMNELVSEYFGRNYARIPLVTKANIVNDNALRIDWKAIVAPKDLNYIFGNPPFIGYLFQSDTQRKDFEDVFKNFKSSKTLDFVSAWYIKSAEYLSHNTQVRCALVSTNSITQGEQAGILWDILFHTYNIKIQFAHRTFSWTNEARGKAGVHCVIIGFGLGEVTEKYLFEYESIKDDATKTIAKNINQYLVEGQNAIIKNRTKPICDVSSMSKGSQPTDDGNLLFNSKEELEDFLSKEPEAKKWIKKFVGAREFINDIDRWCLWLMDISPKELKELKYVLERVEQVREFRSKSTSKPTRDFQFHHLFQQVHQPDGNFLLIPSVSSERRQYIPIGFFDKNIIVSNLCLIIPQATLYHFGVLTSEMHMAWVRTVCGRLKSDYRYSNKIVYNNYPWAKNPSAAQIKKVEGCAQKVLDARASFPDSSLADLYDPLTMPPSLVKAHQELDKAVDKCYGKIFILERKRIEFLFGLYREYTNKDI